MENHKFKRNELGVTYNEFATNLDNQLNNYYKRLHETYEQNSQVFKKKTNAMISNNRYNISDGE